MDELEVGQRLAQRFTIDGPALGWGTTGVVYPAIDADGRAVVAKVLHPQLTLDGRAFARLEATLARSTSLRHAHIVEVLGLFIHGRQSILVSERVAGPTVAGLSAPLPVEAVIAMGMQLCSALAHAHAVGVVHGDVRPGNVLLGPDRAMLFDFGVSGPALGSLRPGETPPEVADGAPPGERADLYGVGLVLARAALGRDPFPMETPWARLGAQRKGLPDLGDRLPIGVDTLLRQLLHPDPVRRPASARALRQVLRRLFQRPDRVTRVRTSLAPWSWRRGWVVHGVDPVGGGAALIRARLTRGEALRLTRRLEGEGWTARAERVALAPNDLLWTLGAGALGAIILPVIGAPLFAWTALRWRSGRLRSELPQVLPLVRAPLPPVKLQSGEGLIVAGLAMWFAAVVWWFSPWLALAPLLLAGALVARAMRSREDPALIARRTRVLGSFEVARRQIEARSLPVDRALGLVGALDALQGEWEDGRATDDDVLLGVERVGRSD
jgi:hypothetical protein